MGDSTNTGPTPLIQDGVKQEVKEEDSSENIVAGNIVTVNNQVATEIKPDINSIQEIKSEDDIKKEEEVKTEPSEYAAPETKTEGTVVMPQDAATETKTEGTVENTTSASE